MRALGADATATQREVYARGLGGSLIHQVNIVHAALDGTGRRLHGNLEHSMQWAGGSAVSCRWRPDDDLVVEASHLRLPAHRRYRETLEFTGTDSVATLTLPSPYARDEGATLQIDTWDADGTSTRRTHRAAAARIGFREQLRAWTRSVSWIPNPGPRPAPAPASGRCRACARCARTRWRYGRRRCGSADPARRCGSADPGPRYSGSAASAVGSGTCGRTSAR